jgi:hypothetical protein
MTRKEQIRHASDNYKRQFPDGYVNENDYIAGAIWSDENPQKPYLSAADRGIIDEIIFALNTLSKEKMISYDKEIKFLNKIRNF